MREFIFREQETTIPVKGKRLVIYAELVRCKDCRWGEPTKNAFGEDSIICGNDDTYIDRYITVSADWFCADGERRDS